MLEMFLWDKPLGLKIFRNTIEKATDSKVLAAKQGAGAHSALARVTLAFLRCLASARPFRHTPCQR
jgi:uncharacterized membrane protein